MPHCIVEYSEGLERRIEPARLIAAVYQGALKSGLFEDHDIKTRAMVFNQYQTGAEKSEFIHVVLKLLSGRIVEQRNMLSGLVLEELASLGLTSVSLTVEVCELEKGSYAKMVL